MEKITTHPPNDTISHGQPSNPIKLNTISDYVYALLAVILYIASIAIVSMFVWNVHQVNDLSALRENLRNDLVAGDIKHIVQMVLRDMGMMEHTPLDDISNTEPPDDSEQEIKIAERKHLHRSKRSARYANNKTTGNESDQLNKRRKRNSRNTPRISSIRKRKKRRNGRPLRLW